MNFRFFYYAFCLFFFCPFKLLLSIFVQFFSLYYTRFFSHEHLQDNMYSIYIGFIPPSDFFYSRCGSFNFLTLHITSSHLSSTHLASRIHTIILIFLYVSHSLNRYCCYCCYFYMINKRKERFKLFSNIFFSC